MRKLSPGTEELGKSISGLEERLQPGNYQGSRRTSHSPLFHLTAFHLIHQLTSNTEQISLQIAWALMWKWALRLAYNYGMGLQFYYYLLFKNPPKGRSWAKCWAWCSVMTPALLRKENWVRCVFSALRPLTSSPLSFARHHWLFFGFSRVQDHTAITIMQSVERLFVSHFLFKGDSLLHLKRNAKNIFSKAAVPLRTAKDKTPAIG